MELEKPDKEVRFSILRLWGSTTEEKQRGNNLRTGWPRALSDGRHLDFWLAAVIWGFSTLEVGGGFPQYFLRRHLRQCRVGVTSYLGAG